MPGTEAKFFECNVKGKYAHTCGECDGSRKVKVKVIVKGDVRRLSEVYLFIGKWLSEVSKYTA
jgi:hypothetical protein